MKNDLSLRRKILKKMGTTRVLTLSFFIIIMTGAITLWMPFTDKANTQLSFIDSLFMATTSVCVTGLVPASMYVQYNIWGHIIIIILMEIGGLGVMSLIAFAITVSKGHLFQSEKRLIQDALNKDNLKDIPSFLKNIIKYTLFFQFIGALLISFRFIPEYGLGQGIFNSIFLSVSAFCNAGLDNFATTNLGPYVSDPLINVVVMSLIILGGLGFAVWFELREEIPLWVKNKMKLKQIVNSLTIHTRIVLQMTVFLIVGGTILVFLFERNNPNTLGSLDLPTQILASFMQSVTLRTAGFSSIDFGSILMPTQLIMILWMFIGGSPGGTAGGIKTTSFVLIFLMFRAQLMGKDHITLFKRTIPTSSFHKAFAVAMAYIIILFVSILTLTLTEPNLPFLSLVFESVSAICTVGLSINLTPLLSDISKLIIIALMFIGRVGPITIVLSMMRSRAMRPDKVQYATGDVLIG